MIRANWSDKDKTVEKALSLAEKSGTLLLSKRVLRSFPAIAIKFNLVDLLSVDLSSNRLTEYPKQLCNCPFLLVICCSRNLLKSLPDEFSQLANLQLLDLSYNFIVTFPMALCQLTGLQTLLINNNRLTCLPAECSRLTALVVLDASNNDIASCCPELSTLSQLRVLKLRNNALESVPSEWSELQLQCLDLASNQLASLPTDYCQLECSLTELHLELNPLVCPPAEVCSRGIRHALKYLSIKRRQQLLANSADTEAEMPWHYRKGAARPTSPRLQLPLEQPVAAASSAASTRDRPLGPRSPMLLAVADKIDWLPQQESAARKSVASSGASPTQAVQYSSSSSVMQRLEQQANRLGGSWTLPRGGRNSAPSANGVAVGVSSAAETAPQQQLDAVVMTSSVVGDATDTDAEAVAAMRDVFERRLGVRLPDEPDRLAARLADGQLLGRLTELAGPCGVGGFSDLCRRLGVSDLPTAQSPDPVMRHLVRIARASIALDAKLQQPL